MRAVKGELTARVLDLILTPEFRVWFWNGLSHVEACRGSLVMNLLDLVFEISPAAANQTLLRAVTDLGTSTKLSTRSRCEPSEPADLDGGLLLGTDLGRTSCTSWRSLRTRVLVILSTLYPCNGQLRGSHNTGLLDTHLIERQFSDKLFGHQVIFMLCFDPERKKSKLKIRDLSILELLHRMFEIKVYDE